MDSRRTQSLSIYFLAPKVSRSFAISWRNPTEEHRNWDFDTNDPGDPERHWTPLRRSTGRPIVTLCTGLLLRGDSLAMTVPRISSSTLRGHRLVRLTHMVTVSRPTKYLGFCFFGLSTRQSLPTSPSLPRARDYLDGPVPRCGWCFSLGLAANGSWVKKWSALLRVNNYVEGKSPLAFRYGSCTERLTPHGLPLHCIGHVTDWSCHNSLLSHLWAIKLLARPCNLTHQQYRRPTDDPTSMTQTAGSPIHISPWQAVSRRCPSCWYQEPSSRAVLAS